VFGRDPAVTISAAFLMGCVGSLILAVVPAVLSDVHGEMRAVAISEANVLASLVATAPPFLVGWLAGTLVGWRPALLFGALISILIGVFLLVPRWSQETNQILHPSGRKLPILFWVYWLTLVLAVSVEFCMVFWSADYMEGELGMQKASAAQTVSLFLAGMIAGRLASSRLLRHLEAGWVVLGSILLGLFGFVLFWTATNPLVGMIGMAVTGFGVASLYPLILSLAIGASQGDESQAGARATLASGVAILLLPLTLGWLADIAGLKMGFVVVAALFVIMIGMMLYVRTIVPASAAPGVREG